MNCSALDVIYECPHEVRQRYLAYKSVVDKARPVLEEAQRNRQRAEAGSSDTMN